MESAPSFPKVSIIIPVRNAAEYLDEALQSVFHQTYPAHRLEVSICDDGSTDASGDIIAHWALVLRKKGVSVIRTVAKPGALSRSAEMDAMDLGECNMEEFCSKDGVEYCFSAGQTHISSTLHNQEAPDSGDPYCVKQSAPSDGYRYRKAQRRSRWENQQATAVARYSKESKAPQLPEGACGPAIARNSAVAECTGQYLCFLDADDVMEPSRIEHSVSVSRDVLASTRDPTHCDSVLYGSQFVRIPADATPRYTAWHNRLSGKELMNQRFRECTIAQPTWFISKEWFLSLGGYDESDWRAEDLLLFHQHIEHGGGLVRINMPLVRYRWLGQGKQLPAPPTCVNSNLNNNQGPEGERSTGSLSTRIHRLTLLQVRVEALERQLLQKCCKWTGNFMIWGAGRDGKDSFNRFSPSIRKRVRAFIDIDPHKIGRTLSTIPVISPSDPRVQPPVVTCVALDRGGNLFEKELAQKGWIEGIDYICLV